MFVKTLFRTWLFGWIYGGMIKDSWKVFSWVWLAVYPQPQPVSSQICLNEENSHYIQGKTSSSCQHEYSLLLYFNPLTPDQICNSPYCQPYNSYSVSSKNLVLDQLIIPKLIFSLFSSLIWLILYWYCKEKFFLNHSWEFKG